MDGIEFAVAQPSISNTFQARWDEWFSTIYQSQCNICQQIQPIQHIKLVYQPPGLISINIYQVPLNWTTGIQLVDSGGAPHLYRLCGVVYYNGCHFVPRVREANGNVWYMDNIGFFQQESPLVDLSYVNVDSSMKPYLAVFIRQN